MPFLTSDLPPAASITVAPWRAPVIRRVGGFADRLSKLINE
jgi:hypothetical protein